MAKNVVLLTIDALRADHVSCYGYERDTTPFLDEFGTDGLVFKRAFSASSHTREAIPALLTGHHPTEAIDPDFTRGKPTIPMLLPDEYATAAFHSNPYVSRAYEFDDGFDHFDDDLRMGQNKLLALIQRALDKFVLNRGAYHARGEEINDRSLSWLDSLGEEQPFFLWNHYMDVHGPYNPPSEFNWWSDSISDSGAQRLYDRLSGNESVPEEDARRSVDLYDGEIRYVDDCIRQFVEALDDRDVLEETLIVITSDHGDLFGEYGQYAHPRQVYPELTHVPLFVSGPEIPGESVSTPASTRDLVPTILDAVGETAEDAVGESLVGGQAESDSRIVFSSATGEDEESRKRRFAAQGTDLGVRFSREQSSGEIFEEVAYSLPDGNEIDFDSADGTTQERLRELRSELVSNSDRRLGVQFEEAGDSTVETNEDIEERLEALGYK